MKRFAIGLLSVSLLSLLGPVASSRAQAAKAAPAPTISQSVLRSWNAVGDKIIAMAEDWPESKYDYRPNADVRTFQQVLLHVAGTDYFLLNRVSDEKLGNAVDDPSGPDYKTKAQTVAFLKKAVADGGAEIRREGDAGVTKNIGSWIQFIEHSGEHYGQLVAYYRNNRVVPPSSRPKK